MRDHYLSKFLVMAGALNEAPNVALVKIVARALTEAMPETLVKALLRAAVGYSVEGLIEELVDALFRALAWMDGHVWTMEEAEPLISRI